MTGDPSARIVDIAKYRQAREARPLPLFDERPAGPRLLPAPARLLSPRDAEHRQRMLSHLGASRVQALRLSE
jgi:hypothetical protein